MDQNKFGHDVIMRFDYKNSSKYILPWTCWITVVLNIIYFWQIIAKTNDMRTYNSDVIYKSEWPTDFDKLGAVNVTRMNGSIPFYSFGDAEDKAFLREE